jgi:hypothetical protein
MIIYEHSDPKLPYTQRKQNFKNLRNTIIAHLAKYAGDPWRAFCLLQDIQFEVLEENFDLKYFKELLEHNPIKKREYQERYDAVKSILSKHAIDFDLAFLVLKNIESDLLHEQLNYNGENISIDA